MKIAAVIGAGRESGKTTTVEALTKELSARGYRVGTIKQIHEEGFSIDTAEKDSWRHAEAGAKIVVVAAPREVAVIKRINGSRFEEALQFLAVQELDIILVEGNPKKEMPKIFAARRPSDVKKLSNTLCISTLSPDNFRAADIEIPVLHPLKDVKKMTDLLRHAMGL
ncbi:MAG: molybdopterin-guanine dinucleotide biosynthesis protein B [Candidatus Hydrothermarchaeales archaeon]